METEQMTGSCPAKSQPAVRTWLPSSTRGATRTPSETMSRFHGDGVRYKAKLIGVDTVPSAEGDKMCWDSMMKLKGFEAAGRKQGKHKQKVWLKVFCTGLKIIDERTGAVLHEHDRGRISSVTKDESDPRALAYIYQHQDTYSLFYIKMANLADPVLADIKEVCQSVDHEMMQESAETATQTHSLLLLNEGSAPPPEGLVLEDLFSPRLDSSSAQTNQGFSRNELMDVFSFQVEEQQLSSPHSSCSNQPESPQPKLSTSQILSIFPAPAGGSPYSSPPYSPTTMPWGLQGPLGNQWVGPAPVAPWPTMHGSVAAWAPSGFAVAPAGSQVQAHCSQPGVMWGGNAPAVNGCPAPLNSMYTTTGTTGGLKSVSPSFDHNPHL